jgi:hypothetical protein
MRVIGIVVTVGVFVAACSGEDKQQQPSTNLANPCATRGATYLFHTVENPTGTCGPIPDQITNVNADGTVPGPGVSCEAITQNGCTARDTNCVSGSNGNTCYTTTNVTFSDDGATASGLITVRCSNGKTSCASTYGVSARRQ